MGFLQEKKPEFGTADEINSRILAELGITPPAGGNVIAQAAQPSAPVQGSPGRRRLSILDALGGVTDALAEFGGSNAGYREGVERREAREAQSANQDWQQKFNQQKFTKGNQELDADRFERFGTAAKGLDFVMQRSGVAGVQKAFPMLAQQMGMDPDEQEIFAASLESDPQGTIEIFRAINAAPENAGSKPKELAIYEMLNKKNPELAGQYLERVASGVEEISPYQREQLRLGRDRLGSAERVARIRASTPRGTSGAKGKGAAPKVDSGTLDLALGVTGELRDIYQSLDRSGASVNPDRSMVSNIGARVRSSGVGQLVEGAIGTDAQTQRDKIAAIRPNLIRRIAEATGMTASQMNSDKDMALLLDQVTDPTRSTQANMEAIRRLEDLIRSRAGGSQGSSSGGSRPRIKLKPRTSAAPGKRMKYNPATGRIE